MKIIQLNLTEDGRVTLTGYIQEPSKEMLAVSEKPAILICPGGAYLFTSDREAEPIALNYAARGFQTFVLRYSVGKYANGCKPLKEASDAIGIIREHAKEWHVKPNQIATCGFSAGGHLAAWVGLCGENKPNAMILGYPAVEIAPLEDKGKPNPLIISLLGDNFIQKDAEMLNLTNCVKPDSIPMFCWHTTEDLLVNINHTIRFAAAYAQNGIPFEYHVFQQGEHGLSLSEPITANGRKSMSDSLAAKWFEMSVEWLWRNFGSLELTDKPYEAIPGLIPIN